MTVANQIVARFHLALMRKRHDEALSLTLSLLDVARESGKIEILWKAGAEQAILLAHRVAKGYLRGEFGDFSAMLSENANRMRTPTSRLNAACADAAMSDDPDAWQTVLDYWARTGRRDLQLPLLYQAAACADRAGRTVYARELLDHADAVANELGAYWPRPVLPAELPKIKLDRLTPAEREVMELARQGLTNANIARKRGTAPGTIGTQLANIYRKLDIRGGRPSLIRALGVN